MAVKDPRINMCVVSGKVASAYEDRASKDGEFINAKIGIEIFNLCYDKKTNKREYKPIAMEVKTLGRPDAKPGSCLGIMRGLSVGDRVVVTGSFECDFWNPKDNPEKEYSKLFIMASRVQTFEAEDKPAPKQAAPTPGEEPIPEDDIPF